MDWVQSIHGSTKKEEEKRINAYLYTCTWYAIHENYAYIFWLKDEGLASIYINHKRLQGFWVSEKEPGENYPYMCLVYPLYYIFAGPLSFGSINSAQILTHSITQINHYLVQIQNVLAKFLHNT